MTNRPTRPEPLAFEPGRVTHRQSVPDLVRLGRDLEKVVLSRAVWSHIHHKVIVHRGRTVVFD